MSAIRSIREEYAGVWFRSRLEARWARIFDQHKITWWYEPEGFVLPSGECYLPDFLLPAIRTVVEVKGVLDKRSEEKILEFSASLPSGDHGWMDPQTLFLLAGDPRSGVRRIERDGVTRIDARRIELAQCAACRAWWFCDEQGSFRCRACDTYEGDHSIARLRRWSEIEDIG